MKFITPLSFVISSIFAFNVLFLKIDMWLNPKTIKSNYQNFEDSYIIAVFFLGLGLIYHYANNLKCKKCNCGDCDCNNNFTHDLGPS